METNIWTSQEEGNGITGAEGAQDIEQGIDQPGENAGDQSDFPDTDDTDEDTGTEPNGQSVNAYEQAEPDEDNLVDENDPDVNSNGGYGGFSGMPDQTDNNS